MPVKNLRLLGLYRAEFDKAAQLQSWMLRSQIGIGLLSAATIFVPADVGTALAFGALLLLAAWAWLARAYRESRAQAERGRRASLVTEALGETVSQHELRDLESRFSVSREEAKKCEDPDFFSSTARPGDQRLLDSLEESAFYSSHLMRLSARRAWIAFVAFFAIGAGLLVYATLTGASRDWRILSPILALLVSTEVLGAAFAYDSGARALAALMARFEAVEGAGLPKADLLLLLSDYNSIVESAPMFIAGFHEKSKVALNDIFQARRRPRTDHPTTRDSAP
jgi:hypothetical protein